MRSCTELGCSEKHYGNGLCRRHWRWRAESKSYAVLKDRKCKGCGATLPVSARIDTQFCTRNCKMKWHRREGSYRDEAVAQSRGRCEHAGCAAPVHAGGLCRTHYMRQWRHGDANYRPPEKSPTCSVEGCGRATYSTGLCESHYMRRYLEMNREAVYATVNARRSRMRDATPKWADMKVIRRIYIACARISAETGIAHHVDHIVPLRGRSVCGLHVPWNLQILPDVENRKKSNKH